MSLLRRSFLTGLLLAAALPLAAHSATPAPAAPRPGVAVAIGGALRTDNVEVWQRLVREAGGEGARFAVFATASDNPQRTGERIVKALNAAGAQAEFIPLSPKLKDSDWQTLRNDPALAARVEAMQGVFFSGGAQELIVDTLMPGGEATAVLRAVRALHARGGVVAGTSAGAAIMSEWMFRDAQDALAVLKGRLREGKEIDRGLGFVGPALFIDQHFLKRGRIARLLPVMQAKGYRYGLGVEENSAALVRGDQIEVIGARGALLVDLSQAQRVPDEGGFHLRGAVLTFLDRGDRHDLATGATTPGAAKRGGLIDHTAAGFKPYHPRAEFFADMLGDNAIVNAMTQLIDSPDTELHGLAFNGRSMRALAQGQGTGDDSQPDTGFEFRLYKGADTRGHYTGAFGVDDYTVTRMYLDVRPVRMSLPLYRPRAAVPSAR